MRRTALAIGGVTVGIAITVVWLVQRAPEPRNDRRSHIGVGDTAADDLVRPRPSAEAPGNSAVTAAVPNTAATPSAPNVAAAPLHDTTLVTPLAQILEARLDGLC